MKPENESNGGKLPELATAPCPPVLCYVDGSWAYFTTRKLSEQWGDDWDDAPYEHNAETPYGYSEHDKKEGREPWEILKVAWDGDFEPPSEGHYNSPWSVEQINAGAVAWLRTSRWRTGKPIIIPAGTTLERFCELIREGGGTVYLADEEIHHRRQEHSRLRSLMIRIYNSGYKAGHHDTVEAGYVDIHDCDMDAYHAETVEDILSNDKLRDGGTETNNKD